MSKRMLNIPNFKGYRPPAAPDYTKIMQQVLRNYESLENTDPVQAQLDSGSLHVPVEQAFAQFGGTGNRPSATISTDPTVTIKPNPGLTMSPDDIVTQMLRSPGVNPDPNIVGNVETPHETSWFDDFSRWVGALGNANRTAIKFARENPGSFNATGGAPAFMPEGMKKAFENKQPGLGDLGNAWESGRTTDPTKQVSFSDAIGYSDIGPWAKLKQAGIDVSIAIPGAQGIVDAGNPIRSALDTAGGIATDPVSYTPFGKIFDAAKVGIKAIKPGIKEVPYSVGKAAEPKPAPAPVKPPDQPALFDPDNLPTDPAAPTPAPTAPPEVAAPAPAATDSLTQQYLDIRRQYQESLNGMDTAKNDQLFAQMKDLETQLTASGKPLPTDVSAPAHTPAPTPATPDVTTPTPTPEVREYPKPQPVQRPDALPPASDAQHAAYYAKKDEVQAAEQIRNDAIAKVDLNDLSNPVTHQAIDNAIAAEERVTQLKNELDDVDPYYDPQTHTRDTRNVTEPKGTKADENFTDELKAHLKLRDLISAKKKLESQGKWQSTAPDVPAPTGTAKPPAPETPSEQAAAPTVQEAVNTTPDPVETRTSTLTHTPPPEKPATQAQASAAIAEPEIAEAVATGGSISEQMAAAAAQASADVIGPTIKHRTLGDASMLDLEAHIAKTKVAKQTSKDLLNDKGTNPAHASSLQAMVAAADKEIRYTQSLKSKLGRQAKAVDNPRNIPGVNESAQVAPSPAEMAATTPRPEVTETHVTGDNGAMSVSAEAPTTAPTVAEQLAGDLQRGLEARAAKSGKAKPPKGTKETIDDLQTQHDGIQARHAQAKKKFEAQEADPAYSKSHRKELEAADVRLQDMEDQMFNIKNEIKKLKEGGASTESEPTVAEQIVAPTAEETEAAAVNQAKSDIIENANTKVSEGTAPEPPTPEEILAVKPEAEAAKRAFKEIPKRNKDGSLSLPIPRRADGTYSRSGTGEKILYANTFDQALKYGEAVKIALEEMAKLPAPLAGAERQAFIMESVERSLQQFKHKLQTASYKTGIDTRITEKGLSSGFNAEAFPLHAYDVFQVAKEFAANSKFVAAHAASEAPLVSITQGSQLIAAARALELADNTVMPEAMKIEEIFAFMKQAHKTTRFTVDEALYKEFAQNMLENVDALKSAAADNLAGVIVKNVADAKAVTANVLENLDKSIKVGGSHAVHAAAELEGDTVKAAEERLASPEATAAAAGGVAHGAAQKGVTETVQEEAKTALAVQRDVKATGVTPSGDYTVPVKRKLSIRAVGNAKKIDAETDAAYRNVLDPVEKQVYDNPQDYSYRGFVRFMVRVRRGAKSAIDERGADGKPYTPRDILMLKIKTGETVGAQFDAGMDNWAQRYPLPETQQAAWTHIRNYTIPDKAVDPLVYSAYQELYPLAGQIFEIVNSQEALLGQIFKGGVPPKHINQILDVRSGIPKKNRFDTKKLDKTKPVAEQVNDLAKQPLTDWDWGPDIVASLKEFHRAMVANVFTKETANDVILRFGKYTNNSGKLSKFTLAGDREGLITRHIPDDVYFSGDVMTYIRDMQVNLVKGSKSGISFIDNFIDPMSSALKQSTTIVKVPGYVARNIMGDYSASMMDGIYSLNPYFKSQKLLETVGQLKTDFDASKYHRTAYGKRLPGISKKPFIKVELKGHTENLTIHQAAQSSIRTGMITNFRPVDEFSQDLLTGALKPRYWKGAAPAVKFSKSRPIVYAGKAAEYSASFTRNAHYLALMERSSFTRQFASLEEAELAAAVRSTRFHPDPSILNRTETQWGRRLIFFYTWIRGIIPAVTGSLIKNPAAFNNYNYFMYGLNEMESGDFTRPIGDPTSPTDFVPDYVSTGAFSNFIDLATPWEALGGAGGALQGSSIGDVASHLGSYIVNKANPLIKAPVELATGMQMSDIGPRKIKDKSDYIDRLLPGADQVAAISGYSVAGTLGNMLGGGPEKGQPWLDPQRAVAVGDKEHWRNASSLQFLTGIRLLQPNSNTNKQQALLQLQRREGYPGG